MTRICLAIVLECCLGIAFPQVGEAGDCQGFVRVAVLGDVTGSSRQYKVPALTPVEVSTLLDTLQKCGEFELGVGLVSADGADNFSTIAVSAKPQAPVPPAYAENPFSRARQRRAYDAQFGEYRGRLADWEHQVVARRRTFERDLGVLFANAKGSASDVFGALQRVAVFFDEDRALTARPSRRLLVAVSDLHDNAGRAFEGLPPDLGICVVNGMGTAGVLEHRRPFRFGSVQPAFTFVASWRAES